MNANTKNENDKTTELAAHRAEIASHILWGGACPCCGEAKEFRDHGRSENAIEHHLEGCDLFKAHMSKMAR